MSIPICQPIRKLRNECEHAHGYANSYTRRRHEDPDYLDENALDFIRTFSDRPHKNYLLARHLKATSNGQWKSLKCLMQGDLDAALDKRMGKNMPGTDARKWNTLQWHRHGDLDAALGKRMPGTDARTAMTVQEKADKSIYVPLTTFLEPEIIEEFTSQKSQDDLDFTVKRMKDDNFIAANTRCKKKIGGTGFPRIDADLEHLAFSPTQRYNRIAEKNQMKGFIETMNDFYAAVTDPEPIVVDNVEELAQNLEEEFFRTFSYRISSYHDQGDQTKLRLSAIIRMLKSMPGYEEFERILYHEPFDRDKPWTWLQKFPKRIPKEYLKRISENILSDMEKWKHQQKIAAMTYSSRKRPTFVTKQKVLQKKRGPRTKNRNQIENLNDDDL